LYFVRAYNECGSAWDTARIIFKTSPTVDLGARINLCDSNSYKFIPTITGSTLLNYRWQDSSTLNNFTATASGVYFVRVFNECGSVWDTTSLQLRYKPIVALSRDTDLCNKPNYTLLPTVYGTPTLNFLWNNGFNTDSIIINKTGNYIVTVSNMCGSDADTMQVNFLKSPTVNFVLDSIKECFTKPIQLVPKVTGTKPYQYLWSNGSVDSTSTIMATDTVKLTVKNSCGSAIDSIVVNLIPYPTKTYFGKEFLVCEDTFATINSHNSKSYHWWNPLSTTDSIVRLNKTGLYTVTITSQSLCSITDSVYITTKDCKPAVVLMPNAFTPNNDGVDDFIYPIIIGENARLLSFKIYNRWGQLVYSPDLYYNTQGWDGTFNDAPQPFGTYYFYIQYINFDKNVLLKGDITLIR
jgi:gliding motility-associated-like protein